MTDCKKADCPFDPVEWGKLIERQDDHTKQLNRIEEKIDKAFGNGIGGRIRTLEDSHNKMRGGMKVIYVLIVLIIVPVVIAFIRR